MCSQLQVSKSTVTGSLLKNSHNVKKQIDLKSPKELVKKETQGGLENK